MTGFVDDLRWFLQDAGALGVLILLLGVAAVALLLFGIGAFVDGLTAVGEYRGTGTVLATSWTAESTGTGVGPSTGGDGGVAVVVTTNPEKFTVMFRMHEGGAVESATVSKETYLGMEKGDDVRVWESVGRILHLSHGFHVEKAAR